MKKQPVKVRELSDEDKFNRKASDEDKFNRKAEELRQKVAKKDPSLTTKTRLKPTAPQLKQWVRWNKGGK